MITHEGKNIDSSCPLNAYPTPQFARDSFFCLNGPWELAITKLYAEPSEYPYEITVPFAAESYLSGIARRITKDDVLHYRKVFRLPFGFKKERVLLHFEAVDQICDVFLNGVKIAHHEGGYLPFTVDCLELKDGDNELLVVVTDNTSSPVFPKGKQKEKPGGIWYTPTSGIWGTVWLEAVPNQVIQSIRLTPLYDERKVFIQVRFEGKITHSNVRVTSPRGTVVAEIPLDENNCASIDVSQSFFPWSPETPDLYRVEIQANFDRIKSYFAMRKFSSIKWNGHTVFALNNKPYFLKGVLDQGYYPDGGLTPPSDNAMLNDVLMLKSMGFNMVRKHIKIEPMRWYYHCDTQGLIVIQDFVNFGEAVKAKYFLLAPFFDLKVDDTTQFKSLGAGSPEGRAFFENEMGSVVDRLYNVCSIAVWTLFNEGWGQFDSHRLCEKLRSLDPTRLIDATSGWFDQGAGDFRSRHIYFRKVKMGEGGGRILSLSECGAYSLIIPGHCDTKKKTFYRYYRSKEALLKALTKLYEKQLLPEVVNGLSVIVLTQLSDVEAETNGLITYDRKVTKVQPKDMMRLNGLLTFEEGSRD